MKKTLTAFVLVATMVPFSAGVWADDTTMQNTKDAVANPVQTYHEHEVKADAEMNQEINQKTNEAKARLDAAKKSYEDSLSANGAESDVTKAAKKRFVAARKEYDKLAMKGTQVKKDLQEDKKDLQEDKAAH